MLLGALVPSLAQPHHTKVHCPCRYTKVASLVNVWWCARCSNQRPDDDVFLVFEVLPGNVSLWIQLKKRGTCRSLNYGMLWMRTGAIDWILLTVLTFVGCLRVWNMAILLVACCMVRLARKKPWMLRSPQLPFLDCRTYENLTSILPEDWRRINSIF